MVGSVNGDRLLGKRFEGYDELNMIRWSPCGEKIIVICDGAKKIKVFDTEGGFLVCLSFDY